LIFRQRKALSKNGSGAVLGDQPLNVLENPHVVAPNGRAQPRDQDQNPAAPIRQ
jgi:hypothetical protein